MLTIPLRFDPPSWEEADDEFEGHLAIHSEAGISTVTWKHLGLEIKHPGNPDWPVLDEVRGATPGLTLFGQFGFNLGHFSEFFLGDIPSYAAFRFGNVEVSFGEPSPLIIYLFGRYRDKHFHGHWSDMRTCRIIGCSSSEAELVLLNAFDRYEERFKILPHAIEVAEINWADADDGEDSDEDAITTFSASIAGDIEPLRCMYYARTSAEPAAACIQYYRVLEYYGFFSLSRKINTLRRDGDVSDREFFLQAAQLLTKDEKGPIVKLIAELSSPDLLALAVEAGLIPRPEPTLLATTLYDFRNSIVHAKHDYRVAVTVDPVVSAPTGTNTWRRILHQLARKTLQAHASRRHVGGA